MNKRLLSGPDLTNQVVGILVNFREDYVEIMADTEAMFYQVFVANQHRSLLSFLWWENGDIKRQPQEYHMNVYVFGGISSPSCSNYALRRTARDNNVKYDPEVAETLRSNFYVDDLLKSVKDEEIVVTLMKDVKALCAEGEFHLTKFVSNSKHVLLSMLERNRRKGLHDQELRLGKLPTEKALGIIWDIKGKKLGFCINFKEKPSTKREMLSVVSSIYDPLGLVSPFLLESRRIIQILCHNQLAWYDPVDEGIQEKWAKWKCSLNILKDIKLRRCYKPKGFVQVVSCSLPHFSDASENGYGQVVS